MANNKKNAAVDVGTVVGLIQAMMPSMDTSAIQAAVESWLNDHPEATTTVADGAITEAKLASAVAAKINQAAAGVSSLSDEIDDLNNLVLIPTEIDATTKAGWSSLIIKNGITLEKDKTYRFSITGTGDNTRMLMLFNSSGTELARYNKIYDGYFDYTPESTLVDCYLDYRSNIANASAHVIIHCISNSYSGILSQLPQIILGNEIPAVVGDTLQLFFSNFFIGDVSKYVIKCSCDIGRNYPAYYEVTPTASNAGNHTLTIAVYSNEGGLIAVKNTNLKVVTTSNPVSATNVLCLGDSRMAPGEIPIEASRRLKGTQGTAITPQALSLTNYNFVGRLSNTAETVHWEGIPGHGWSSYTTKSTLNPFYYSDTDTIDFARYATDYCNGQIDIICILLGINNILNHSPFELEYGLIDTYINGLCTLIHTQLPNTKIIIATEPCDSPNGGIATNYTANANNGAYNAYGFNYKILKYDQQLIDYFENTNPQSYIKIANAHAQFQCEYAFPTTQKAVNTRSDIMETLQNNGVHPNNTGYWQLSDALAFRAVLGL